MQSSQVGLGLNASGLAAGSCKGRGIWGAGGVVRGRPRRLAFCLLTPLHGRSSVLCYSCCRTACAPETSPDLPKERCNRPLPGVLGGERGGRKRGEGTINLALVTDDAWRTCLWWVCPAARLPRLPASSLAVNVFPHDQTIEKRAAIREPQLGFAMLSRIPKCKTRGIGDHRREVGTRWREDAIQTSFLTPTHIM